MRADTVSRLVNSIQLLKLDGYEEYTNKQLADASGITKKTISRNSDLITMLDFALARGGYQQCWIQL